MSKQSQRTQVPPFSGVSTNRILTRALALLCLLVCATSVSTARDRAPLEMIQKIPSIDAEQRFGPLVSPLRADTAYFGNEDGSGFAVLDGLWDFDTDAGSGDPFQGWYATDVSNQSVAYFRQITDASWAGHDNLVDAPVLVGSGSAWAGAFQDEADALCWPAGLGYGNSWCQRLISPEFEYTGTGNIALEMLYFNDTEPDYDYTRVILQRLPSREEISLNFNGFHDQIGLAVDHPASPPVGAPYLEVINSAALQGETRFQIIFEVNADEVASDEDGQFTTDYGPFGADDVTLSGSLVGGDLSFDFESGLGGWAAEACPGFGTFIGIEPLGIYTIEDPCQCELASNILEFHDDDFEHPYGEHVMARSAPIDVTNDVEPVLGGEGNLLIFADWDQYSVLPRANGVLYRPGWDYYPFECDQTGTITWSGRAGGNAFAYLGDQPICATLRDYATANGIPTDIELIRFIYEIFASCDSFGIPPEECTNTTNFTPIIDNIKVGFTRVPAAPTIGYDNGTRFQDGFAQTLVNTPTIPGNADIVRNVNFGDSSDPAILGDSLLIRGPAPSAGTEWESKLWFRIRREGPYGLESGSYLSWRDLYGGTSIVGEDASFASAFMDSAQRAHIVFRDQFVSYLREDDPRFNAGAGEFAPENEIIRDGILYPGTAIDYFVTAAYAATPEIYSFLPDTTGGYYHEFEILPSFRDVGGQFKFPCMLYIDAYGSNAAQRLIETGINATGIEFDRYDYEDASSNWKAPLARGAGQSNNGATLIHLMGYRSILLNTGLLGGGMMTPQDFVLFGDWMQAIACDGNLHRQGFIANGDNFATALTGLAASFLADRLGATQFSNNYAGLTGDEAGCVQLEAPIVSAFGTSNSTGDYDYDAWGNWCPQQLAFDVLSTSGDGVGNRVYVNTSSFEETQWAQVIVDDEASNYRSVLDGISYHHLSERDAIEECVADSSHIVTAVFQEVTSALEWIFEVDIGSLPSLCLGCTSSSIKPFDPPDGTTRLFQNSPNPFNPRTRIRFALAQDGPVEVAIFDVAGRKVRTLTSGILEAGIHEVVWDGANSNGDAVGSGVFWSQMTAGGHTAAKKMVVLR